MENNVMVSVVMPFHNGEQYIHETMKCITEQTLKDIEIICVDDESTDKTYELLKEYADADERITVLKQKKANAGAARNLGMSKAKGKYLLFLDSDDLFELEFLEEMVSACEGNGSDVCVCDADQYNNETGEYQTKPQYFRRNLLPEIQPFSYKDIGKYILYFTTSVPWNKLVRASFIKENNINFQEIDRANDQYFSIMTLLLAKNIVTVDKKLVHYRVKQTDNLTKKISETPLCAYEAMLAVKEELDGRGLLENADVRCAFDNKVINLIIYSLNSQNTLTGYKTLYDKVVSEGFERLGVMLKEQEYYFNELEYKNFYNMLKLSCEEFLHLKNYEYRNVIERKNINYKKLNEEKKEIARLLRSRERELAAIKATKSYRFTTALHKLLIKLHIKKG